MSQESDAAMREMIGSSFNSITNANSKLQFVNQGAGNGT